MFIKFSFGYARWYVPHSAGGIMAFLIKELEIVDLLPSGVLANKALNMKIQDAQEFEINKDGDNKEQNEVNDLDALKALGENEVATYDYYLDCQGLSRAGIEEAITTFLNGFEEKQPLAMFGEGLESEWFDSDEEGDEQKAFTSFREGNSILHKIYAALASVAMKENNALLSSTFTSLFSCPQQIDPRPEIDSDVNKNDSATPVFR